MTRRRNQSPRLTFCPQSRHGVRLLKAKWRSKNVQIAGAVACPPQKEGKATRSKQCCKLLEIAPALHLSAPLVPARARPRRLLASCLLAFFICISRPYLPHIHTWWHAGFRFSVSVFAISLLFFDLLDSLFPSLELRRT